MQGKKYSTTNPKTSWSTRSISAMVRTAVVLAELIIAVGGIARLVWNSRAETSGKSWPKHTFRPAFARRGPASNRGIPRRPATIILPYSRRRVGDRPVLSVAQYIVRNVVADVFSDNRSIHVFRTVVATTQR